ncbi:hypothetical protein CRUP_000271 [Coryphaenoides rupestris]|nr:hypothetical protein CRUP_000271 [Coryphaenoides rupestris]
MPGHNTGTSHAGRHHKTHVHGSRVDRHRPDRTVSRESNASQESYKDHHHHHHYHQHGDPTTQEPHPVYLSRYSENNQGRRGHRTRSANGRGSESIGFIPGSADNAPDGRHACGSCTSMGWSGCKALLCCVLTCGFYGGRKPCLPINESSTDRPSKADSEPCAAAANTNGLALSNPTCGIPLENVKPAAKPSELPNSGSFRYPDVRIAGQTVVYPAYPAPKHTHKIAKGGGGGAGQQRPISDTSVYSREDLDLDDLSDTGTDIDSLITKKLLELYALHQIDQLAKCTSDSSFSRKTNEISELIYSIAQDYNLEKQEAECKLVHGVIRISTRKTKRSKNQSVTPAMQRPNVRSDGTLPDSGNETMTFMSSDMPEVKVSELTSSDELARKMRHFSGRTLSSGLAAVDSPYRPDTETDSSGAPLLHLL